MPGLPPPQLLRIPPFLLQDMRCSRKYPRLPLVAAKHLFCRAFHVVRADVYSVSPISLAAVTGERGRGEVPHSVDTGRRGWWIPKHGRCVGSARVSRARRGPASGPGWKHNTAPGRRWRFRDKLQRRRREGHGFVCLLVGVACDLF